MALRMPRRKLLAIGGGVAVFLLLVTWLASGTPFLFNYSHEYPMRIDYQGQPPVVHVTVTNDTLRPCDAVNVDFTLRASKDGALLYTTSVISSAKEPEQFGALGPCDTRNVTLPVAFDTFAILGGLPNDEDPLTADDVLTAQIQNSIAYCTCEGLLGPLD